MLLQTMGIEGEEPEQLNRFVIPKLSKPAHFQNILGVISMMGGLLVLYMRYETMSTRGVEPAMQEVKPKSLAKGIWGNALSPPPYLFWLSIGAPMLNKAMKQNLLSGVAFIGSFNVMLVGSKNAFGNGKNPQVGYCVWYLVAILMRTQN